MFGSRRRAFGFLTTALLAATLAGRAGAQPAPTYEVYAIRYGVVKNFRTSGLIAGADTARRMDLAMMVWLLKGPGGRNVLVDAGFHRDDFVQRWKPVEFSPASVAVERAGVKPDDVTDLIITHIHWDHLDGIDLFPRAHIWIQREEYEHHIDSTGAVLDRAIDRGDAALLFKAKNEGRVVLIDGDAKEIIPGITVYTGGKHTFASQYAGVHTTEGTVVIASDNVYTYENIEQGVSIAQTLDVASNLRAQQRMLRIASSPRLIVPGHDPAVFTRFPSKDGIARIR